MPNRRLFIAIVEDNPVHRQTYASMVHDDNPHHSVDVFPDGESFRSAMQNNGDFTYDCILFDIKLPDCNGIELAQEIQATHPLIPIIFITAYSDPREALETLKAGAEDYLPKGEYNQVLFMRSIRYAIERKEHRNHMLAMAEDLRQQKILNAQQKEFVSMCSHEFRTPLAIIKTSIQLIERALSDDERAKVRKHFDKTHTSIDRLERLIDSALSYSKLEEGKVKFIPQLFDLDGFIDSQLHDAHLLYPDFSIERQGETLPNEFWGDSNICGHIFSNLISNAVKYTRGHGEKVTIHTRIASDRQSVIISIIDEGRGMSDETIAQLGQRFYRAEDSMDTFGSGIGLFVVHRMLELHQGSIYFESELGKGTKATISLPISNPDDADA